MLLDANATANTNSSRGYTPLALARFHDRADLIELLESIDAPAQMKPPKPPPVEHATELPSNVALHLVVREEKPVDLCGHAVQSDGNVEATAGRNGGSAIKFNGGCLRIPHHADFNAAGGITVATWLRLDPFQENENAIISKGRWERNECPWEMTLVPDWWISFHCYGDQSHERCQFQCPNHDQWHHVAAVWDGDFQRLFIDGDERIAVRVNQQPKDNSVAVTIGRRASDPDCYPIPLFATLEDLLLFSRPLSSEEIANVMGYIRS